MSSRVVGESASSRSAAAVIVVLVTLLMAAADVRPGVAEASTTAEGVLEVVHEDHFGAGRSHHLYSLRGRDGAVTQLLFDDRGPEGLGGRRVRVAGTPVGRGRLHVGKTSAVTELASTTPVTTGQNVGSAPTKKKIAVILFNFSDRQEQPISTAEADAAIFGAADTGTTTSASSNDYYFENAFGSWSLSGAPAPVSSHIFGWITLPNASTESCNYSGWGQAARAKAAEQGFVDANYDHVVHIMTGSSCTFGGIAYMPGRYSWTVAKAWGTRTVAETVRWINSHELGHNFGVHHSGSYRCTSNGSTVVLSSTCSLTEYGDPFSVMGNEGERHMTNYQKGQLGWLASGATQTVTSGTTTVQLQPVETASSGVQSLRIPTASGKNRDLYYVEYRTSYGFDTFAEGDSTDDGVLIRIAPDYATNTVSKLLDGTPSTATFNDAAFVAGQSFHDPNRGVTIKVLSVANGTATVEVTYTTATRTSKK